MACSLGKSILADRRVRAKALGWERSWQVPGAAQMLVGPEWGDGGEPPEMMEEKGRGYWGALLSLVLGDWDRNLDVGSKPEGGQWWLLGWGLMCQSCIPAGVLWQRLEAT